MNSEKDEIKERIRARYKGNQDNLDIIIADEEETYLADDSEKRVAVYVRVSSDSINQTSSFELQKNYYTDIVDRHEGWTLVDIYADEGITGTSLDHRDSFLKMIEDCKAGMIDLIVTKSVSRFARNLKDCTQYADELKSLKNPVGIYFENENIYTFNPADEIRLSLSATIAQEESRIKSTSMNSSIEMRFSRGILLTPVLLGYDHDEDGNLVINEEEASTVRLIFFLYLYGCSCQEIADKLVVLGRKTKIKNETWSASTVREILHNERHCGDVLARKTYTPNYLNHKSKKNNRKRNQYYFKNHHEAIISRDDFIAVQHMMQNAKYHSKYSNKSFLPELYAVSEGILKGYVAIHPTWGGFTSSDYLDASKSVYDLKELDNKAKKEYQADEGDFDFRGFEIARSQFFDQANKTSVTFGIDGYIFSTAALRKLDSVECVEILLNPITLKIAVRIAKNKNSKYAIRWVSRKNGALYPNKIAGAAYINTIYKIFCWNEKCRYRVNGVLNDKGDNKILFFDITETEVFIPYDSLPKEKIENEMRPIGSTKWSVKAYPKSWIESFGNDYYVQQDFESLCATEQPKFENEITKKYSNIDDINVTSRSELKENISNIINEIKGKVDNE